MVYYLNEYRISEDNFVPLFENCRKPSHYFYEQNWRTGFYVNWSYYFLHKKTIKNVWCVYWSCVSRV